MTCQADGEKPKLALTHHAYYKLVTAVPFFTAAYAVFSQSTAWGIVYLLLVLVHMTVVYRLLCTHCPLYAAQGGKTNCHFIWGAPGFFKARPEKAGPASTAGLVVSLMVTALFPLPWLIERWELLVVYFLGLGVLFATLMKYECKRCEHHGCPKNQNNAPELSTLLEPPV